MKYILKTLGIIILVIIFWATGTWCATMCLNSVLPVMGLHKIGFMDTVALFGVGIIFRCLFISNKTKK